MQFQTGAKGVVPRKISPVIAASNASAPPSLRAGDPDRTLVSRNCALCLLRCHAHGFAWAGYANDSNSAARVPCVARGIFDTETYRPINITSSNCGPPRPPPPGAASRVITIT
jgi:hypothetical protein